MIGGKKKKEEEKKLSSPAPQSELPSSEPSKSAENAPSAAVKAPKTKRTTKLGMIGGKGKKRTPVPPPEPGSPAAEQIREQARESPAVNEEDTTKAETTQPAKEVSRASPEREETAPPSVPVETEEQKTARKREELKRQLAEQSKAPKKKRRF